jgi:hypothetical protein
LLRKSARTKELKRGRSARRSLRKDWTEARNNILRKRHGSHRLQQGNRWSDNDLCRGLMTEMAVRAASVIVDALMVPVADHTRSKYEDRDEREGNTENAKSLLHRQ